MLGFIHGPGAHRAAQTASSASPYTLPAYFTSLWTPSFTIFKNGTTYSTNYNPDSDKPTPTRTYYVDPVAGNDTTGDGTISLPYKTLAKAHTEGGTNVTRILAKGGWYDQTNGFTAAWAPTASRIIESLDGGIVYINRAITTTNFTFDSGNVYRLAGVTGVATVLDLTRVVSTSQETLVDGVTGVPLPFLKVADKATCNSTQYSYFDDGVDLYVHVTGSAPNTTNVKVLSADNVTALTTGMDNDTLWLSMCEFWGNQAIKWDAGTSGSHSKLIAQDTAARYAILDNWDIDDITTRLIRCKSTDSRESDGFNYHRNVAYTWGTTHLEVDCYGARNGYQGAGNNDNNFTTHDRIYFVRVGCVGREAKGPNFADTAGSFGINLGCQSFDALGSPEEGYSVGAASASYEGVVWYEDCSDVGSTRGFSRSTGAHMVLLSGNTGTQNGTIIDGTVPANVNSLILPTNTVAPTESGTETEGQTLTGTQGTWTGGLPVVTYARQWQRNVAGTWTNILGATSSTYVLQAADVGTTVRHGVSALVGPALDSDALATVWAYSAPTGTIAALPPGSYALMEDNSFILMEDNSKILLEA
jgi:hypothetical protein